MIYENISFHSNRVDRVSRDTRYKYVDLILHPDFNKSCQRMLYSTENVLSDSYEIFLLEHELRLEA